MGLADRIERRLESTVGDAFARVFGGSIVPQEVEALLRREAETHARDVGGGRVLAPNDYVITLSETEYQKVSADPVRTSTTFARHLAGFIQDQGWQTYGDVVVRFAPSPSLHTGQFRTRGAVNPDSTTGDPVAPAERKSAVGAEPGVPAMTDNPSYRGQGQGRPGDEQYDDRYRQQDDQRGTYPPEQGGYPDQGYPQRQGGYSQEQGGYPDQGYPPPSYEQRPPAGYGQPPAGYGEQGYRGRRRPDTATTTTDAPARTRATVRTAARRPRRPTRIRVATAVSSTTVPTTPLPRHRRPRPTTDATVSRPPRAGTPTRVVTASPPDTASRTMARRTTGSRTTGNRTTGSLITASRATGSSPPGTPVPTAPRRR
ncbi:FHA domain-containing protein [Mycolicibacterium neoaurum]|uniref:FHA domain-containing protein n=1 Tax=Mycolicibacterium neoaurum TaxID=1795 RepID=A0AAV2WDG0_MYCNE|nr:FHA domain-containing protein [Mycolicibacterium neoaurum]